MNASTVLYSLHIFPYLLGFSPNLHMILFLQLEGEMGQIHIVKPISIPQVDEIIALIKEKADIVRKDGVPTIVKVTGNGCSVMREKLEKKLDIK